MTAAAEHTDPGNPTQEQIEDQAWKCFRLRAEGRYVHEIAQETGLSRETVKRRLNEKILSHETPPREWARALEIQRLELVVRAIMNELGRADRDTAKLSHALVATSKRIAALRGLDEPTRRAIAVSNTSAEEPQRAPWLSDALAEWKAGDIYQDDLRAAGRP